MRILHTSDWHLGAHSHAHSRADDHDRFFAWLVGELKAREIDVLVVAGDIFDHLQPSAEALRRYYGFLAQVSQSGIAQMLVVGGNHDSASRLDAPTAVLEALRVNVVGGIFGHDDALERCVIPLKDRTGVVAAVALGVPYVHEFRLGVRTTDPDAAAVRQAFTERFGRLYRELADRAQATYPGLPIIATGHLTMGAAKSEDYPQQIHQVGAIDALPNSILDPRIQYTALGHIHRSYPVGQQRRAWYSGTPIAFSLPEGRSTRRVLQVDLATEPDGHAVVTAVNVPVFRALRALQGTPDELLASMVELTWAEPLPPLLYCTAVTELLSDDLAGKLRDALHERFAPAPVPLLAELRQAHPGLATQQEDVETPETGLRDLGPVEVFDKLCDARAISERDGLKRAFASLVALADEAELRGMVDRIAAGAGGDHP